MPYGQEDARLGRLGVGWSWTWGTRVPYRLPHSTVYFPPPNISPPLLFSPALLFGPVFILEHFVIQKPSMF